MCLHEFGNVCSVGSTGYTYSYKRTHTHKGTFISHSLACTRFARAIVSTVSGLWKKIQIYSIPHSMSLSDYANIIITIMIIIIMIFFVWKFPLYRKIPYAYATTARVMANNRLHSHAIQLLFPFPYSPLTSSDWPVTARHTLFMSNDWIEKWRKWKTNT